MLAAIVLCAAAFAGCDRLAPIPVAGPAPAAKAPVGPVAVALVRPERRSLAHTVELPGTVQAFEETQLIAKVSGFVRAVHADIGQRVSGPRGDQLGQALVELAVPELLEEGKHKQALVALAVAEVVQSRKALAAAEAGIAAAQASVGEAKAGVARAQALYDRWSSESARMTGLAQGGVVDAQTRDETTNQLRAADANRQEARAHVGSAEAAVRKAEAERDRATADIAAAEAKHEVAKADARRLDALLGYATIRAPYDGVVTRRKVNTGDLLQAGRTEGVLTVARIDPVRAVVEVPEAESGLVRDGTSVRLTFASLRLPELKSAVTRSSWALETGARTLRVEIDVPNADGRYRVGAYFTAKVDTKLPEAWTLPVAAVVKKGNAMACYAVENGKAVAVPVEVGRSDGQFVEVRRRQLAGTWGDVTGTETVASNAAGLSDGATVATRP